MLNATVPSPYDSLYGSTDLSSLNWFEQRWVAWYIWINNPIVATGLASFLMHEFVYFGRCVPWIIIDAIPYFRKWKLQPSKLPTAAEQWECTKLVLFSHVTIELPLIWLFHPLAETIGMRTYHVPFPTLKEMAPQVAFFFVFEDLWHFLGHRALHTGVLYKHIHKIHHKYSAPFGLAAEYAHPAEVFFLAAGTLLGPLLYCIVALFVDALPKCHMITMYIWVSMRLCQAIDAHSGYDFPWSLHHFLPFWAGSFHHDYHHATFVNNFSSSFQWWDYIFGTDASFRAYQKRLKAARETMKGASDEEVKRMEQKLMDEAEIEGLKAEAEVLRQADGIKEVKVE